MPKLGHFLELFEALSRRDWDEINAVAQNVVEYERGRKHFDAADKLRTAIESAISDDGFGDTFIEAKATVAPPIDLLERVNLENIQKPILSDFLENESNSFLDEWKLKDKLLASGLSPRNKLLFYGPPGCGKSLLAKYLAKKMKMDLYMVRFDTLISSYLGETGSNLRKVFQFIENNRCILFIDEIDAIAKLRDDQSELGELKRVVISLLQNVDTISSQSILVAATNHAHLLDSALWRRFDVVFKLDLPSGEERARFVSKFFGGGFSKEDIANIVKATEGFSGADLEQIAQGAKRRCLINKEIESLEAIFISIIDHLRRTNNIKNDGHKDNRVFTVVTALKKKYKKKYSYNELETMSGIPHSTLHHKVKAESVQ